MSYSTPASLAKRIGPRIYVQLTAEAGEVVPDATVAQNHLDKAMLEIDVRVGHRGNADAVALLAGLEEQIALWFMWSQYRAFGEQEASAAAAKVGYDNAIGLLESGKLTIPAEEVAGEETPGAWKSNAVVFSSTRNF